MTNIKSNFKGHAHTKSAKLQNRLKHLGKTHTEKTKLAIRNKMLGRRLSISAKQKVRDWHINHPNRAFSNTSIEQKIAAELRKRKIIFKQNFGILTIKNVDFYLPLLNVVIECDGCFYHACPKHGHKKYHQQIPSRDKLNTKKLKAAGYTVFRFWGHEINTSVEKCVDKLILKLL